MNCAYNAFLLAANLPLSLAAEKDMAGYYSMLRDATGGDTGVYIGCAHWALNSTINYGYRCGWIEDRPQLHMWYADWVNLRDLVRGTDDLIAAEITQWWWGLAFQPLPVSTDRFIVFDLALGHTSYQCLKAAQFPMAAMWVDRCQKGKGHVFNVLKRFRKGVKKHAQRSLGSSEEERYWSGYDFELYGDV